MNDKNQIATYIQIQDIGIQEFVNEVMKKAQEIKTTNNIDYNKGVGDLLKMIIIMAKERFFENAERGLYGSKQS